MARATSKGGWMGNRKTEVIDISVDELALSLVGWQVVEAQARLLTESHDRTDHEQQLAFSATFRFLPEDWTDRFKDGDGDNYASEVLLALNRRDIPAPTSNYTWVVLEKIRKAAKNLLRVSTQSDTWTCRTPLAAKELDLRLTAYDLDDVSDLYINSKLSLPSPTTTPLEIIVVDETSADAPRVKVAVAHAYISNGDYRTTLTMHAEGTFEFGSAEDLLKAYADRHDWVDDESTVNDSAPFEVDVPEVKFEILDDTGFPLNNRTCRFYGHIPIDDEGNVPRRRPRWIGRDVIDISKLPGDPHRVVVRVTDGDE
ncbi:hypothetical protein JVX93_11595 [Mycolicibacterium boenickei]|nr:hypothetical protein JVX93_11595 [Mycolicibacterium boenickei]